MRCRSHENVSGADQRQMSEGNTLEYFEKRYHTKRDIAYHYTSLEAFMSIVQNKTFRLTSLNVTNDILETSFPFSVFNECLSEALNKLSDQALAKRIAYVANYVDNDYVRERVEAMRLYALSLSTRRDNWLHWKAYANAGTGVCIGVNISAIDVQCKKIGWDGLTLDLLTRGSVLYNSTEIIDFILKKIESIKKNIFDCNSDMSPTLFKHLVDLFIITDPYCMLRTRVKNGSFSDEYEQRIVFEFNKIKQTRMLFDRQKLIDNAQEQSMRLSVDSFEKFINSFDLETEGYYLSQYGIKSYRNLCFNEVWGSGVIPEVILGPLCRQNKDELKSFLESNGLYGVEISDSQVPLR